MKENLDETTLQISLRLYRWANCTVKKLKAGQIKYGEREKNLTSCAGSFKCSAFFLKKMHFQKQAMQQLWVRTGFA